MPELPAPRRKIPRWILYTAAAFGVIVALFVINRAAYLSAWYSSPTESATGLSAVASSPALYKARSAEGLLISAGPNITRASSLSLHTQKFDRAVSQIPEIVRQHDGYLEEWKIHSRSDRGHWLEASLRVTALQADSAVAALKALGEVEQESEADEDVRLEKETLAEKLLAERANLARLKQIVDQHKGSLHDVVEAEEQMASLREKVGDLERQSKKLLTRGSYATVSLTLVEDYRARLHRDSSRSFLYLRNSSIEGIAATLSSVTICLGFLLHYGPMLLIWGGLSYAVLTTVRRSRRTSPTPKPSIGI
jgi:hypothetical protein